MTNGILFAIVFLWLLTLTITIYHVFRKFENHQHLTDLELKASPPATNYKGTKPDKKLNGGP